MWLQALRLDRLLFDEGNGKYMIVSKLELKMGTEVTTCPWPKKKIPENALARGWDIR